MLFKEASDKWYPNNFWVAKNEVFAISVIGELFGRLKLQVLYKYNKENDHWFVVEEYVTYKPKLLDELFDKIVKSLLHIEVEDGDWEAVLKCLPKKEKKYLEDKK